MDKPVFILGCTKSGTTLMRNLFDGHPAFFVVPMESHFFQLTKQWVSYYQRRTKPQDISFDQMKSNLTTWVEKMNLYSDKIADNFTQGKWDLTKFKEKLFSTNVSNLKDLSDLYIESIYEALYNCPYNEKKNFVEKSVENVEFVAEWLNIYPNARFIHILRNPYSNIVSFRKYLTNKSFPFLKGLVYSMYTSYYYLYKNMNLSPNYKVVIYEELISEPERIMKDISGFLGVEYDESMLYPTLLGENWKGNSTSNIEFNKISNLNIDKWKNEISHFEIHLVNELFDSVIEKFGFEHLTTNKSKFLPVKNEFRNYISNRFLWRMMPKF